MKGLLVKDFKLLKNQKQFFATVAALCVLFLTMYENPYFVISYLTIMCSMFSISTISYDEMDNGMTYIFTFPISRRQYVVEKYIFGMMAMFFSWIAIMAVSMITYTVRNIEVVGEEIGVVSAVSLTVAALFIAVSMPVQLKFGAERASVASLIVVGFSFFIGYVVVRIVRTMHVDVEELINILLKQKLADSLGVMIVSWILLVGVSFLISIKIMEKREF